MLSISNLTKYYGKIRGVENLNLEIKDGETFGFIGPNGAGKSTTVRLIMNMIKSDTGTILINNIENVPRNTELKEIIGYLPSEINLYDDYTIKEMINYSAQFYHQDLSKRIDYLVKKLQVDINKKIEDLSLGNLKKVGIILAMMHEPKLLILDEPTSGLDPLMQEVFYELLLEEKKKGTTIFFSSHILGEVKKVSDRIGIIKDGNLVKIIDMKKYIESDEYIVDIISKDFKKISSNFNSISDIGNNHYRFVYNGNSNELLKILNKCVIDSLYIEEPSLEDLFMEYYK